MAWKKKEEIRKQPWLGKFNDAKEKIALERRQNPDNLLVNYLDNYIDFLKVTLSEDEVYFNSIENKVDETIRLINKLDDSSRFKKYFLGNIFQINTGENLNYSNILNKKENEAI